MQKEIESAYIKRILKGETSLFCFFVNNYSHMVFAMIVRIVQSREDAEELTQDTFMKAYSKLENYRGDCSFSSWLCHIAYNTSTSWVRKQKTVYPAIDENIISSVADTDLDKLFIESDNEQMLQAMEIAIEKLAPEEKALITLFYFQNKSVAEVYEILQLSTENINKTASDSKKIVCHD